MFTFSSNNTTAEYRSAVEIVGLAIDEKYGHTAQRDVDLDIDVTMYASGNQDSPSAFSDIGVGNGLRVTFNHAHKNFTKHTYNADGEFVGVKMARKNGALVVATIAQAMALSSVDAKDRFYTTSKKNNGKSGSNKKVRAQAEDKNSGKQSGRDAMENFGLKLLANRRGFEIADVETYKQIAEEFASEIDTIRKLKISDDYTPRVKADTEAKPKNIKVICDTDEDCSFMEAVKSFVIENGKASEIKDWHCPQGHLLIDATTKTTSDVVTEAEKVLATA